MKKSICTKNGFVKQRGLSLVELMVSLVIGMAVLAGCIQVVVNSKREFMDQGEVQFIQTNARYALDLISKDVRMAGYLGCATHDSIKIANSISDDASGFIGTQGLIGFDGEDDVDSFPAQYKADATVGTDSFIVRYADSNNMLDVQSHNPASATIQLWGAHTYTEGSTLMIADSNCRSIGLFQVSGVAGGGTKIVHNANSGVGNLSNNCTKIAKGEFSCASPNCNAVKCNGFGKEQGEYSNGSKIMTFVSRGYYVGDSDLVPGMPALKRQVLVANPVDNASRTETEEVALGVEDFEVTYGVDADGDGNVDQYRSADAMDVDGDTFITSDDWAKVQSVKLSLVFRSQGFVLPADETKLLLGKSYTDRYLRQLVNTTVQIRNRG